jgi:hypothetical protein
MNFETYLKQAWNDHATQTRHVADGLRSGIALVESSAQIVQVAGLITHVMGEHLGLWVDGISLLDEIKNQKKNVSDEESEKAVLRSIAVLKLGMNPDISLLSFSPSDRIRILSTASSAFVGRDTSRSKTLLDAALSMAKEGLDKSDPASRALAIAGNNLACTLEEKGSRTLQEIELMILAATTGRKYWERAGSWLEIERAEYRLANTYLKANQPDMAFAHAQLCVEICKENNAAPLEFFFGYEVVSLAEKARANDVGYRTAVQLAKQNFEKLSEAEAERCEATLKKLLLLD